MVHTVPFCMLEVIGVVCFLLVWKYRRVVVVFVGTSIRRGCNRDGPIRVLNSLQVLEYMYLRIVL